MNEITKQGHELTPVGYFSYYPVVGCFRCGALAGASTVAMRTPAREEMIELLEKAACKPREYCGSRGLMGLWCTQDKGHDFNHAAGWATCKITEEEFVKLAGRRSD